MRPSLPVQLLLQLGVAVQGPSFAAAELHVQTGPCTRALRLYHVQSAITTSGEIRAISERQTMDMLYMPIAAVSHASRTRCCSLTVAHGERLHARCMGVRLHLGVLHLEHAVQGQSRDRPGSQHAAVPSWRGTLLTGAADAIVCAPCAIRPSPDWLVSLVPTRTVRAV